MAQVEQVLTVARPQAVDVGPAPAHRAGVGARQAAQDAQQAGLAMAVGCGHAQQLPGAQLERHVFEQQTGSFRTGEPFRFKHGRRPSRYS